jgi:hypothetical protein
MVFSVSPSVTVREVDLTTTIPAITTPPAAIAGVFRWGPVGERVLISSEIELANVFGTPTDFNAETFFAAADFLSYSNALYVTRVVSASAAASLGINSAEDAIFAAKYPGSIANNIEISYVTGGTTENADAFISSTPLIDSNDYLFVSKEDFSEETANIYNIDFNDNKLMFTSTEINFDIKTGDTLLLGTDDVGYQTMEVVLFEDTATSNTGIITYEVTFLQRYRQSVNPSKITRAWKNVGSVEGAPSQNNIHIIVIDRTGAISGDRGTIIEKFENLSLIANTKSPEGSNLYYKDVLNTKSRYISAGSVDIAASISSERDYINLTGGSDGDNESNISFGRLAQGYDLYKEANDVDVSFILQGKARGFGNESSLANYLISNIAESRRDCMIFISPNRSSVVDVASEQAKLTNVIDYRNSLQNSSYWVMDTGYKYRYDKYNDVFRWIPLNGDIAGLASLVEPWESPAGYRKGRIRNVIKLAFNPNKTQRDQLYGKDINPVITQVGQGTILFGDKTGLGTATGSAFTRINVRRLFITVEKAIATIAAQLLFEFNDEFTQNQFRQITDPFLRDIQGRRGIIDFRVVSDATVNTPQVVDSNTFRSNIFIKPSRSINFIELTFVATRTGVEFEEIVGQQF